MTGQTPDERAREMAQEMARDFVELIHGMQTQRRNDKAEAEQGLQDRPGREGQELGWVIAAEAEQWLQDRPGREGQKLGWAIQLMFRILEEECGYDVDLWLEAQLDTSGRRRTKRSIRRRR